MIQGSQIQYSVGLKQILQDVNLSVESGQLVALCGPNGAGKSTLLRIMSGEIRADAGSVHLLGKSIVEWKPKELAQFRAKLSQESQLTFSFRVREVVEMGRFPHDHSSQNDAIVQSCMERMGILTLEHRDYTSLSGGEKQRVHLARVLAQLTDQSDEPKLLLLDEPTSALDLHHQEVALALAKDLCENNQYAVIVVLHDLNLAAAWADRIVLLKNGQICQSGSPAEVLNQPVLKEVYGVDAIVLDHPVTGRPIVTIDRSQFSRPS